MISQPSAGEARTTDAQPPTRKAVQQCAEWLAYCLSIGWGRDSLDALEHLWWEYHDHHGCLITTHDKCKFAPRPQE